VKCIENGWWVLKQVVGIEKWVADIEKFDENERWESKTGVGC
jgi:hypothetical protein